MMKRHAALVSRVIKRLNERNCTVNLLKSHLFQTSVDYLGFRLGRDGVSLQKQKQLAILNAPFPQDAKALHSLCGCAVWMQRCLRCNLAELLKPLRKYVVMSQTTKKYILPFDPTDPEVIAAVNVLKERIANAATVHPPNWDLPFHCFSDGAQSAGVGGCICQFIVTGPPRDALSPTPEIEEKRRHRKGEYNELDKITGLDKPNRRLPSQQCPPPRTNGPHDRPTTNRILRTNCILLQKLEEAPQALDVYGCRVVRRGMPVPSLRALSAGIKVSVTHGL